MRPTTLTRLNYLPSLSTPFSTSSPVYATAANKLAKKSKAPTKQVQNVKRTKEVVRAKPPASGERKAYRKRIQLSNNSALQVNGTDELKPGTLANKQLAGKMFKLPADIQDRLRTLDSFKPTQSWNLFRTPHVLLRPEVADLMERMENSKKAKEAIRTVVTGTKLSGKSLALLQAQVYGLMNGWVVINVPEGKHTRRDMDTTHAKSFTGQDLTNGNTEYSPIADTDPIQFSQPVYTFNLLNNLLKANEKVLKSLKQEKDWSATTNQKKKGTLAELILSAKEADFAWPTFNALWQELQLPGRPPVLFTLDGLSHINMKSDYRDPNYNVVHAHELTLIRTFVDALSGKTKLPNGGAILAATSGNNFHRHPSQELVLSQLEAGQKGEPIPQPDPYEKHYDNRVYDALKNSTVLRIEGMSKPDARVLMEYWGASGLLRAAIDHDTVCRQWALGGHGNVGEMERSSLMTMKM